MYISLASHAVMKGEGSGLQDSVYTCFYYDVEDTIPVLFRWEGGGDRVSLSGSFVKWDKKINMQKE